MHMTNNRFFWFLVAVTPLAGACSADDDADGQSDVSGSSESSEMTADCISISTEALARGCEVDEAMILPDPIEDCRLKGRIVSAAGPDCVRTCRVALDCDLSADICAVPACQVPTGRACIDCMIRYCVDHASDPDCELAGF